MCCRDYYAGKLGDSDLEERLLQDVDEGHFRAICQTALEGLASKKLNLDMLVERRAKAQERRVVPETIARFIAECAQHAALTLKPVSHLAHTFDPGRIAVQVERNTSTILTGNSRNWRFAIRACQRTATQQRNTTSNG